MKRFQFANVFADEFAISVAVIRKNLPATCEIPELDFRERSEWNRAADETVEGITAVSSVQWRHFAANLSRH